MFVFVCHSAITKVSDFAYLFQTLIFMTFLCVRLVHRHKYYIQICLKNSKNQDSCRVGILSFFWEFNYYFHSCKFQSRCIPAGGYFWLHCTLLNDTWWTCIICRLLHSAEDLSRRKLRWIRRAQGSVRNSTRSKWYRMPWNFQWKIRTRGHWVITTGIKFFVIDMSVKLKHKILFSTFPYVLQTVSVAFSISFLPLCILYI